MYLHRMKMKRMISWIGITISLSVKNISFWWQFVGEMWRLKKGMVPLHLTAKINSKINCLMVFISKRNHLMESNKPDICLLCDKFFVFMTLWRNFISWIIYVGKYIMENFYDSQASRNFLVRLTLKCKFEELDRFLQNANSKFYYYEKYITLAFKFFDTYKHIICYRTELQVESKFFLCL